MHSIEELPDELVLSLITYLDAKDIVALQGVTHRFCRLARDNTVWKLRCFEESRANQAWIRRSPVQTRRPSIEELREAVVRLGAPYETLEQHAHVATPVALRSRAIADWDPTAGDERIDFHNAYIQRHAPIAPIGWLQSDVRSHKTTTRHAKIELGSFGVLRSRDNHDIDRIYAPDEDGYVCCWDLSQTTPDQRGRLAGQSRDPVLRAQSHPNSAWPEMSVSHVAESVCMRPSEGRGLFAVGSRLTEVDLETLQEVSSIEYGLPISAVSAGDNRHPPTICTQNLIHIYDSRGMSNGRRAGISLRCEPLTMGWNCVNLPLSVMHLTEDGCGQDAICIAGRFKSLITYDRRNLVRASGNVYTGSYASCVIQVPFAQRLREMSLVEDASLSMHDLIKARAVPGATVIVCGDYKGKGSLEFYDSRHLDRRPSSTITPAPYRNRQTASSSPLLAVAAHGASYVTSDGNGVLKWFERDGSTMIRTHDLDERNRASSQDSAQELDSNVFVSRDQFGQGDIVRKIVSTRHADTYRQIDHRTASSLREDLVVWTGEGRIGVLGFGHSSRTAQSDLMAQAVDAEEAAKEDAERKLQQEMSRMLARQADEARFMRGFGLG